MKNDNFRRRLEKMAEKLTVKNRSAAKREAEEYCKQLDEVRDLSDNGPLAEQLEGLVCRLDPKTRNRFEDADFGWIRRKVSPADIRRMLIQYFQLRRPFDYEAWEVVDEPDPARPDRDNLRSCTREVRGVSFASCGMLDRTLWDVFHMLGQLARNVKSVFLPRVIQFLIDMDGIRGRFVWWLSADRAERMVDEFIACWKLVMKEVSLLDDVEKPEIWPKRPIHDESPDRGSLDTTGMSAEDATDFSRDTTREDYDAWMAKLASESHFGHDAFAKLAREVGRLASAFKTPKLTEHLSLPSIDYAFLARLLSVDTRFSYNSYEDGVSPDDELVECSSDESTPEDTAKRQIVNDLALFLTRACKLAKEIGSKSYDDLSRCQELLRKYRGEFYWMWNDYKQQLALRDLRLFITGLKRSVPVLAADVENYVPPKAAAPKRKKKWNHQGNGLKGPKTRHQDDQLKVAVVYLKDKPIGTRRGGKLESYAKQCWNAHPKWKEEAKATGENRGYASYRSLAKALDSFYAKVRCAVK